MKPMFFRFDYAIRNPEGEIVDTSREGGEPLWFVEGDGRMMPGLERALRGKSQGDEFEVTIGPDEAYGWPQQSLIKTVSKEMIAANVDEIEVGMIFQVGSGDAADVVRVVAVDEDGVTIDGNHPLAGITFRFEISVLEARPATADEVEAASIKPQRSP